MLRFRTAVACVLGVLFGGLAIAQPPPQPWVDFSTGFPKPGSVAGEISTSVDWKNCSGIGEVQVSVYKTVNNQYQRVGPIEKKTSGVGGGILLPQGNFAPPIQTGEPQGTVISAAKVQVLDNQSPRNVIVSYFPATNVIVP
jgi:hypothetical protein